MKTFIGTPGRTRIDLTGDMKPALLARLEYGLTPFDGLVEAAGRRLHGEPDCVCGHSASTHYDHLYHPANCPCEGYFPRRT